VTNVIESTLRALLERATRTSSFRRSLPISVGGGGIYVSGSGGLKYLFRSMGSIDPSLCSLAREFVKKGHVVWDVGANVGLFTFAAAHLAGETGKVVAFDADIWLAQLLRRSASIQPSTSAPVQVVPAAIASGCDLRTFNIALRSRASNFLQGYGQTSTGGVAEQQTVVSVSIDWLAERLPPPEVIKIDVEGAELEVLRGATGLLGSKFPVVLCEVGQASSREVTHLFKSMGYRIYDGESRLSDRHEVPLAPWNTVAIHGIHG
jgi:FkbM family methyltransferase